MTYQFSVYERLQTVESELSDTWHKLILERQKTAKLESEIEKLKAELSMYKKDAA